MKLSQIRCWKSYCSEPLDKIEHYEEASAEGFADWCIHHRLEIQADGTRVSAQELIDNGLYYDRPASELVFIRTTEHHRLHWIGNTFNRGKHHSADTRRKMSEALSGENHPFFGKHRSDETRQKMSAANKGDKNPFFGKRHSEESRKKMSAANKGKHCWNNGISSIRSRECPGEGWTRGRLRFK